MKAIREKYEAPVMISDPIEIHLTYLRAGLDEVKSALPVLRDKIDALSSTLHSKIEKTNDRIDEKTDKLSAKIDQVNSALSAKIDQVNSALSARIDHVNSDLGSKISTLTNGLADVRGIQKAMFWVLGSAGALTALASLAQVARSFGWI